MNYTKEHFTEEGVANVLAKRFMPPHYAFLTQVRNGTGFSRRTTRTADAMAMSLWPSRGLHLSGIEIKVSYSDFKREMAKPEKAEDMAQHCHYWWIAAPNEKIAPPAEVPANWGLILIDENKQAVTVKDAVFNSQAVAPDYALLASILRNVAESTVSKGSLTEWRNGVEAEAHRIAKESMARVGEGYKRELDSANARIAAFEAVIGSPLDRYEGSERFRKFYKLAQRLERDGGHVTRQIEALIRTADQFRQPMQELAATIKAESEALNPATP